MNRREIKQVRNQKAPVKRIFRKFAQVAATLILVSPLILGCGGGQPKVQIANSANKPARPAVVVPKAEKKVERPERRPIDKNPFLGNAMSSREGMPEPVSDENPYLEKESAKPPILDCPY